MEEKLEVGDKLIIELTNYKNNNFCNIELQKQQRNILLAFGLPLENEEDLIKNLKMLNVF